MNIPALMNVILIPAIVLVVAMLMMAVQAMQAGRKWPKVQGWWLRALLLNAVQVGAVSGAASRGTHGCCDTVRGAPTRSVSTVAQLSAT